MQPQSLQTNSIILNTSKACQKQNSVHEAVIDSLDVQTVHDSQGVGEKAAV